jgi:hypothetical protein
MFLQNIVDKTRREEEARKEAEAQAKAAIKGEKKVATQEETKERVEAAKGEHEREEVIKRIEPILRKAWPDIETITVYELEKNTENLDFAGCDAMIRFKDGSVIHAAFRENEGGPDNWYTFASMQRRSSVRKYEGKAMQSVEIQTFKQNKQLHILDSDEVYKFAYEFQKNRKPNTVDLMRRAREKGIDKDEFLDNAHQITFDKRYASTPEKEDAIRIKYKGYNNLNECRVVEVLHKWEKYNFKGKLIEKGSHGVDRHSEYYKEKTKALEAKFPVETRLAYEKEAVQKKKELFAISKNTENEKGANTMNMFIDTDTIQKFEGLDDICVGYDPKADTFVIFDERTKDVWAMAADIDELNELLDDKIVQMLETGEFSDNEKVMDILEELEALEDMDDVQEKEDQVNDLKGELYKIAGEIAETIDLEELEIQAAISRERYNGNSDSNGDSMTLIPSTA